VPLGEGGPGSKNLLEIFGGVSTEKALIFEAANFLVVATAT
jgi:hypothetical protein